MIHSRSVTVTHPDPHCKVWIRATASLWGMADDHDLDEPVRLSLDAPVRLTYGGGRFYTIDRELEMKTVRAGHHTAVRFYFRNGSFKETEIDGVSRVTKASVVNMKRLRL